MIVECSDSKFIAAHHMMTTSRIDQLTSKKKSWPHRNEKNATYPLQPIGFYLMAPGFEESGVAKDLRDRLK